MALVVTFLVIPALALIIDHYFRRGIFWISVGLAILVAAAPLRAYLDWAPLFDGPQSQDILSLNPARESLTCRVDIDGLQQVEGISSIFAELYHSQAIFAAFRRREAEADGRVLTQLTRLSEGELNP